MTAITRNEHSVLRAILTNDFRDGDSDFGREIWANCLDCATEVPVVKGHALSGTVASLAKKNLIRCSGAGRDATIWFASQAAMDLATSLGPVA